MEENKNYKYIELMNGDKLLAIVDMSKAINGFLKLQRPLKMIISEDEEIINYGFAPWIPFSDEESVPLSTKSIVTIAKLNDETIELYKRALAGTEETNEVDVFESYDLENEINYLN